MRAKNSGAFPATLLSVCFALTIIAISATLSTAQQTDEEAGAVKHTPLKLRTPAPPGDTLTREPAKLPTAVAPSAPEEQTPGQRTQRALEQSDGLRLTQTDDGEMRALTDQVLNALPPAPEPAQTPEFDEMREKTSRVLDALDSLNLADQTGDATNTETAAKDLRTVLEELVAAAQKQGESAGYVENLIEEAVKRGGASVPDALQDDRGRLNTTALLASVMVSQEVDENHPDPYLAAIAAEGSATRVGGRVALAPGQGPSSSADIETSSLAASSDDRYITVVAGDTLGGIALQAYGDSLLYPRIYRANQDVLKNPNDLVIGQRLRIP